MKKFKILTNLVVLLVLVAILFGPLSQIALAATLLNRSNTMSSLRAGALSNHEIIFRTPAGVDAPTDTITITFPALWTMGPVAFGDMDLGVSIGGLSACAVGLSFTERNLAASPAAGVWGAAVSGQIITLTAPTNATTGEIAINSCVRIRIGTNATFQVAGANRITNSATAGSHTIAIAGTFGNSGNIAVTLLTDDQVAVTSAVHETITFVLGASSVALGTLSIGAPGVGSHTVTLATNAANGLVLAYSGTTLTSGAHTIDAMSTTAESLPGTEQFGINAMANATPSIGTACSGTAPIAAAALNYNTANSFRFVTGETIISSTGAINSTTCTISYIANIAGLTEAGAYTTALTYIASAQF